jgi:type 2 lantibiotic biosynthesis protein LanM
MAAGQRPELTRAHDTSLLTASAQVGLQRGLLARLSELCAPTLHQGFTLFRMVESPVAMYLGLPVAGDPGSRATYDRYIAVLRGGELRNYFMHRPVLARLVATVTDLWIEATAEFIGRLRIDLPMIRDAFYAGRSPGPVTEIGSSLSDPHNGGRTVLRLTFANGLKIGYKPKDLGLDVAWRKLLCWLEDRGAPSSADAPAVVTRQGYGWVEWIEPAPCTSPLEASRFFHRAGAMLCLLQTLGRVDFHFENVLARSEHPVPVDLETLMHPRLPDPKATAGLKTAAAIASERLHQSVLATGYLPAWLVLPGGKVAAMGGLNPVEVQEAESWQFRHVNTDGMKFEKIAAREDSHAHLPTLESNPLSSASHRNVIGSGYEAMYRFLMDNRMALLDADGPLAAFNGQFVRILLQPTQFYFLLIQRSLKSLNLGSGVDWDFHFDLLTRLHALDLETEEIRTIRKMEHQSLRNLDIPFMGSRTDRSDLVLSNGTVVEEYFERTSFEQLMERVRTLSETALQEELQFIDQALKSAAGSAGLGRTEPWRTTSESGTRAIGLTSESAIAEGQLFATVLHREAVREGVEAAWVAAVPLLLSEQRVQLQVIGHDLYGGASGIALFLSALYRLTGEQSNRELALAAFEPFRSELKDPESRGRLVRLMGIGGGAGLGSVIYALVRSAELLGEPALIGDATRAATLISDARISADRSLDIVHGAAGAILGLLALYQARPEGDALERASSLRAPFAV